MAKGANQLFNDQDVLLSIGPFMGLDTTSTPYLVPQTNCVSQQNVAVNRTYGAYTTAQGRVAAYTPNGYLPFSIQAIGISNIIFAPGITYVPGIYVFAGGYVYYGGNGQSLSQITSWNQSVFNSLFQSNIQDSKFVFAGSYVFLDCPVVNPQFIANPGGNLTPYNAYNWGIVGPSSSIGGQAVIGGVGTGNLTGQYNYACTFVNNSFATPVESSPSPFSSIFITANSQNIGLSGIPTSTDPQVTARNIYRIGGTIGGTSLLVGTINDNTTTTYTDSLPDNSVTGQQMILRQDPAPANGFQAICFHKGRMWGFGPIGSSNTSVPKSDLWYSNYKQYTSFNSVTQVLDCNTDISDSPIALVSLDSVLVALKQQSIWLCYGDSQNDFITRRTFSVGCVSKGSVAVGFGRVFWLSSDGVYSFDGANAPINISDGNIPSGSVRTTINSILAAANNNISSPDVGCRGWIYNRTYYLSVYSLQNSFQTITLGYDLTIGAWTLLPYSLMSVAVANGLLVNSYNQSSNTYTGTVGSSLVLGTSVATPQQIDQWFAAETDYGNPIVANWTSGISDSGLVGITKQYRYIEVIAPTQSTVMNVQLTINPGANQIALGPYNIDLSVGSNRHRVSLPTNAIGYECQLTITTDTSSQTTINRVAVLGYTKRAESPQPYNG